MTPSTGPAQNAEAMTPPAFSPVTADPAPTLDATHPGPVRLKIRKEIFTAAWTAVRDKDFDRTLGGLDWNQEREKFEPLALSAPDERSFFQILNQMLARVGQSHLQVHGEGESREEMAAAKGQNRPTREFTEVGMGQGDPGITVRLIEEKPTVTRVRPGSSADQAGLRMGHLITHIGGHALLNPALSARPLRPVEEKFRLRRTAAERLSGPVGSRVTVRYLDAKDRPHEVFLSRDAPSRPAVQVLLMPPLVPEVRTAQLGPTGVIAFNFFLLDPILPEIQKAIDSFRQNGTKTLILDLRGNPGGFGSMAIPIATKFLAKPTSLGGVQFRDFTNTLEVVPPLHHKPFAGKLFILTDEGTASTAEILAAGLQEAKRAVIVGGTTVGAVLGSTIEELPGGAIIQIPVAGYKTPKGVSIEGRGVMPDHRILESRASYLAGRDMVLEETLELAKKAM